ncbi:MAG: hypothetical protein ABEJ95_05860 [Candidatus Nanohalobium sp.]
MEGVSLEESEGFLSDLEEVKRELERKPDRAVEHHGVDDTVEAAQELLKDINSGGYVDPTFYVKKAEGKEDVGPFHDLIDFDPREVLEDGSPADLDGREVQELRRQGIELRNVVEYSEDLYDDLRPYLPEEMREAAEEYSKGKIEEMQIDPESLPWLEGVHALRAAVMRKMDMADSSFFENGLDYSEEKMERIFEDYFEEYEEGFLPRISPEYSKAVLNYLIDSAEEELDRIEDGRTVKKEPPGGRNPSSQQEKDEKEVQPDWLSDRGETRLVFDRVPEGPEEVYRKGAKFLHEYGGIDPDILAEVIAQARNDMDKKGLVEGYDFKEEELPGREIRGAEYFNELKEAFMDISEDELVDAVGYGKGRLRDRQRILAGIRYTERNFMREEEV